MTSTFDAAGLYSIVERYSGFGNHHTGTDADRATSDWILAELRSIGATATTDPWSFDQWMGTAELLIGDYALHSLPVFYSGLDAPDFDGTDLHIHPAPFGIVGSAPGVTAELARATTSADANNAVVLAIESFDGLPVQCNRVSADGIGIPAVIVASRAAAELASAVEAGTARLRFSQRTVPSTSANIVATLGDPDAPTVTITTPLTGWTTAAGERGTGLAVALAMASDLAADHRVTFVGCSGHELDHLGLRHHIDALNKAGALPHRVVHLGASVAAVEWSADVANLAPNRAMFAMADEPVRTQLAEQAVAANWTLTDPGPHWPGEGGTWQEAGSTVLSFVGWFDHFHTTNDTTERATTPAALAQACATAIACTRLFLEATPTR